MARDKAGRYTSAREGQPSEVTTAIAWVDGLWRFCRRPTPRKLMAGVLTICSGLGYAGSHWSSAKAKPTVLYETTYDSSEPDPAKRFQHRIWTFDGAKITWRYTDPGAEASGTASQALGMNGSIGLLYGPADADGPSLGAAFVRPLHFQFSHEQKILVGYETGHSCACGPDLAHDGPFTSVPAVFSTTPEIPKDVQKIVFASSSSTENFAWPEDVAEKIKAMRP